MKKIIIISIGWCIVAQYCALMPKSIVILRRKLLFFSSIHHFQRRLISVLCLMMSQANFFSRHVIGANSSLVATNLIQSVAIIGLWSALKYAATAERVEYDLYWQPETSCHAYLTQLRRIAYYKLSALGYRFSFAVLPFDFSYVPWLKLHAFRIMSCVVPLRLCSRQFVSCFILEEVGKFLFYMDIFGSHHNNDNNKVVGCIR